MPIKALQELALHLAGSGTNSLSWKISELTELVYWIVCWSELCFISPHYDFYNRALVVQVEPMALHYHITSIFPATDLSNTSQTLHSTASNKEIKTN